MTFATVLYEKRDGVGWVTLNRPAVLNAYNIQMRDDLWSVVSAVRDDRDVRVLVFRGAGRAFCAGADLSEFGTAPSPTAARRIRFVRDVWDRLASLEIPTVALLHGHVVGSGLELALFCDIRVAAEGAQFRLPEAQLGLIPAAGGTQTLPRACGVGAALDLLMTGRRFDATEAQRLGLVSRIVPPDALADTGEQLAATLAAQDRRVMAAIKAAVRQASDLSLADGLRLESRLAAALHAPSPQMEDFPS
jgi:enoyl-CoA hydratase/carnithine racemase